MKKINEGVRILVTGAGAVLGQGIIRSLRWSSIPSHIIAVDPNPLSAGLYWADQHFIVSLAKDFEYISEIEKILEKECPDIIMIGTDVELSVFSHERGRLEEKYGVKILVCSAELVDIANDKYKTFCFLKEYGFNYPETCLPGEEENLIKKMGFPLIVKPRIGARSIGVYRVENREQLRFVLSHSNNQIIQECVGDEKNEYTAGSIFFDNEVKGSIIMRRDLKDGNTFRAFVEPSSPYEVEVRNIVRKLNPYGPVNLQFRIDSFGKMKVFEINSRFSGTTPLRAKAGFNEVEYCVRFLMQNIQCFSYEIKKIIILRYWNETVIDG